MLYANRISGVVLKVLGAILLAAAALKGYQLLSEPVANTNIWTYRPFLILQVELELAMGIWLLCGLFKKAAWLAGLACFSLFSLVTFYKGLTGAASCGCFGSVHVNPWITLLVIDLPAVIGYGGRSLPLARYCHCCEGRHPFMVSSWRFSRPCRRRRVSHSWFFSSWRCWVSRPRYWLSTSR